MTHNEVHAWLQAQPAKIDVTLYRVAWVQEVPRVGSRRWTKCHGNRYWQSSTQPVGSWTRSDQVTLSRTWRLTALDALQLARAVAEQTKAEAEQDVVDQRGRLARLAEQVRRVTTHTEGDDDGHNHGP